MTITKKQWQQLEKDAWAHARADGDSINHPKDEAIHIAAVGLDRYSKSDLYEAGQKFADKETWPFLAYRLNR
jgi:hypothetical protein